MYMCVSVYVLDVLASGMGADMRAMASKTPAHSEHMPGLQAMCTFVGTQVPYHVGKNPSGLNQRRGLDPSSTDQAREDAWS